MTAPALRDYQERDVAATRRAFAAGFRSVCLTMATGAGKTRCAAEIMRSANAKRRKCLFLARRLELLQQCRRTLTEYGIDATVIQGDNGRGAINNGVLIASVPTLVSDVESLPEADFVIWDECHGVKARTSLEIKQRYSTSFHLGLTATVQRGDGSPLKDAFDTLVVGATTSELTALGHLVPVRVYAPPTILDPRSLALEPVDAYERHCAGRKTVVFCTQVEHARRVAAEFTARGIRATYVSGDMSERSDRIAAYAAGDIDVLVNVNILVEGWDDPPTSAAIFARRFTHAGPYLQACGRVLRTAEGKADAVIVDLCGSALVHGTPDAEREYSLDGKGIRVNDRAAIRQCAACGGVFLARPDCPFCGAAAPVANRSLPTARGVDLGEVSTKTKPTAWPMCAKKRSLCAGCGQMIKPGTWIVYSATRRMAKHTSCASARAKVAA